MGRAHSISLTKEAAAILPGHEGDMNILATRVIAFPLAGVAAVLAALTLSGCATFSKDGGFDLVAAQTRAYLHEDVHWPRTLEEQAKVDAQVAERLAHGLSAEDAVQIALLNSRGLRACFEELGVSEADLVQSGRLPNPQFTLRHAGAADQYDVEETLSFNVLWLITAPYARKIEKHRFAQAQSAAVIAVVQVANDTRQAYFAAVAARESVRYLEQVKSAAVAGDELARRMVAAGNWNLLDQAREQRFYTDAAQVILQNRIDLRLMRMQLDELAQRLRLTKATRFINVLDAGPARVRQGAASQPYERGYQVSLEIPLFDGGGTRERRAQALYSQAVDRFAQAAIDARAQIREAYAAYRAAFDIAKQQRDEVVPARKAVAEQNLLRYNASLISIFDLLSDARGQIASIDDYIQSVRDFWMAKSELDTALLSISPPLS